MASWDQLANFIPGTLSAGVGLLNGRFPMIDIDVDDAALSALLAAETRSFLGLAPDRVGRAPRTALLYQLDASEPEGAIGHQVLTFKDPGGVTQKVEVRGGADIQCVVDAEHPGTGLPYTWSTHPVDIGACGITSITSAQITPLLDHLEWVLLTAGCGGFKRSGATGAAQQAVNAFTPALAPGEGDDRVARIIEALQTIPNQPGGAFNDRNAWLGVLYAVRGAAGSEADNPALVQAVADWSDQWRYDPSNPSTYMGLSNPSKGWFDLLEHTYLGPAGDGVRARYYSDVFYPEGDSTDASDGYVSLADYETIAPPPRRWLVKDWLPIGSVAALFGPGGVGKSLLAQQLGTAVVTNALFLGLPIGETGPVLALFGEDDSNELGRRHLGLCRMLGVAGSPGIREFSPMARAGEDNTLVKFDRNGTPSTTELFARFVKRIEAVKPRLVIIDNIAQCFGGNENDRAEVTAFATRLTRIARDHECAVLLIGHPSKVADSKYSGSTAWDAAVRTRLYFGRPEEEGFPSDYRILSREKANYAPGLDGITVTYSHGAFIRVSSQSATDASDDAAFLAGLLELDAQGGYASLSAAAQSRYAPKALRVAPACSAMTGKRIEAAMKRLLSYSQIAELPKKLGTRKTVMALQAI